MFLGGTVGQVSELHVVFVTLSIKSGDCGSLLEILRSVGVAFHNFWRSIRDRCLETQNLFKIEYCAVYAGCFPATPLFRENWWLFISKPGTYEIPPKLI